jgi:bifunctional UDP-N-acetylglucosamine pyrophosphorylase / glucosamine-1-phosphate N-acetyltransferase
MPNPSDANLNIVILAAGKGTRMFSNTPKVLHQLAGQPLLGHVLQAAGQLKPLNTIVIYGFGGEAVPSAFKEDDIVWVRQEQQLGTGHAVQQALPAISPTGKTLILLGDVPMLNIDQCRSLLEKTAQIGLMTVKKQNPYGYGRIVRDEAGGIRAIIEHKDASPAQLSIDEVNTGIMVVENSLLKKCLARLNNQNAQGEYYLTDIIAMAVADGYEVASEMVTDESSVEGVNSKQDLAALERVYQTRQAAALLQRGVTIRDPHRLDIRGEIEVGQDVEIDIGCVFEGKVILGDGVKIGAYCVIKDTTVGLGTAIAPFTHTDQVSIAANCKIGPYARLRPGTILQDEAHVGNFVELKNAQVNLGSKINHLSYVGDATVGKHVNIGAGTITCNYDGANKFRTVIEDYAFIGSDSQLVAPVTVGNGATIGAGSTITKDAPAGELTIARGRQVTVKGWKRPQKNKQ